MNSATLAQTLVDWGISAKYQPHARRRGQESGIALIPLVKKAFEQIKPSKNALLSGVSAVAERHLLIKRSQPPVKAPLVSRTEGDVGPAAATYSTQSVKHSEFSLRSSRGIQIGVRRQTKNDCLPKLAHVLKSKIVDDPTSSRSVRRSARLGENSDTVASQLNAKTASKLDRQFVDRYSAAAPIGLPKVSRDDHQSAATVFQSYRPPNFPRGRSPNYLESFNDYKGALDIVVTRQISAINGGYTGRPLKVTVDSDSHRFNLSVPGALKSFLGAAPIETNKFASYLRADNSGTTGTEVTELQNSKLGTTEISQQLVSRPLVRSLHPIWRKDNATGKKKNFRQDYGNNGVYEVLNSALPIPPPSATLMPPTTLKSILSEVVRRSGLNDSETDKKRAHNSVLDNRMASVDPRRAPSTNITPNNDLYIVPARYTRMPASPLAAYGAQVLPGPGQVVVLP
jgi:hypothetical protein